MKAYDEAYFNKWYRNPRHRVSTSATLERKVFLAVGVAEYYLGRPVGRVLDVGCGEGQWRPALKKLRPGIRYTGVDPSEYAIRRFGRRRNLLRGAFGDLPSLRGSDDLLICSDTLYYVPDDELIIGLEILVQRLVGVAFLEAYPSDIEFDGDTSGMFPRSAAFYRKLFRHVGLVPCGSHCYAAPALHDRMTELEGGAW